MYEKVFEINCEDVTQYGVTQYKPKQGELQN